MSREEDFEALASSPLRIAAVGFHELYSELRRAGFTRSEALRLVSDVMVGAMNDSNGK